MVAASFTWTRPEQSLYPIVWRAFAGPDGIEYVIRDLVENEFDDAINLMKTNFLPDEPIAECLNMLSEPESVEILEKLWRSNFVQKVSIGCFNKKTGELVGVNFLEVLSKSDPKGEPNKVMGGPAFQIFSKIYQICTEAFDVYEHFGFSHYLSAYGLGVLSSYRKQGIATELLKARFPMMKELSIPHTCTFFTGTSSQKTAEKAGFSSYYEQLYGELVQYPLQNIKAKSAKIMGAPST